MDRLKIQVYKRLMDICPFVEGDNITCVWQWWSHSWLSINQLCMEQSANTKLPQNRQVTQMQQCGGFFA